MAVSRVERGLSVEINFQEFLLEQDLVFLKLYEGFGESKQLTGNTHTTHAAWVANHDTAAT